MRVLSTEKFFVDRERWEKQREITEDQKDRQMGKQMEREKERKRGLKFMGLPGKKKCC